MLKVLTIVATANLALAASAFAQSHVIPSGDTVDITPPIDLTRGQVLRARPADRALLEGRSVDVARPAPLHPSIPGTEVRH